MFFIKKKNINNKTLLQIYTKAAKGNQFVMALTLCKKIPFKIKYNSNHPSKHAIIEIIHIRLQWEINEPINYLKY